MELPVGDDATEDAMEGAEDAIEGARLGLLAETECEVETEACGELAAEEKEEKDAELAALAAAVRRRRPSGALRGCITCVVVGIGSAGGERPWRRALYWFFVRARSGARSRMLQPRVLLGSATMPCDSLSRRMFSAHLAQRSFCLAGRSLLPPASLPRLSRAPLRSSSACSSDAALASVHVSAPASFSLSRAACWPPQLTPPQTLLLIVQRDIDTQCAPLFMHKSRQAAHRPYLHISIQSRSRKVRRLALHCATDI